MINKNIILILFVLLFSVVINADVPPDIGEIRVNPPLIFTPNEDFSDYRFFLQSPVDIEEVIMQKDKVQSFDNENRGGAKKFVTLIAISKVNLKNYEQNLSEEKLETLLTAINNKEINNVIELLKHSFQKDISVAERLNWTYPQYKIERSDGSIKAVVNYEIAKKISEEEENKIKIAGGSFKIYTIVAGILITLAVIILGIFIIRKK